MIWSFSKIYSLISETWKFKNYQFESQIASTGNRLPFVLTAVDQSTNETTACDKILLISVLYCSIYLAFKILIKFCSHWIASFSKILKIALLFAQLTVASVQQILGPGRNWFTAVRRLQWNIWNRCILRSLNFHFFIFLESNDSQAP